MKELTHTPRLSARARRRLLDTIWFSLAATLIAASAIWAKEQGRPLALAAVDSTPAAQTIHATVDVTPPVVTPAPEPVDAEASEPVEEEIIRYFDGRPVRPVRTVWMTVTAYSPDHRSCGKWADGVTASNKSVWTNDMSLVAADTDLLPMGTMLSIPGYDQGSVVPVLDRGGAIKGDRLDVLYPTHEIALEWGVQRLPVTIWEYADE